VRGSDASPGFAVEILVEEHVIAEMRVKSKFRVILQRRTLVIGAL
jgi:hypothetical protein